tara:strand:+ start:294 stop:515 length:222 start_codon:yes stop_codon:yes gene_type:complete
MSKTLEEYPELIKEFHPTKNGNASPKDFTYGTQKKYGGNVLQKVMNGRRQFLEEQVGIIAHIVLIKKLVKIII